MSFRTDGHSVPRPVVACTPGGGIAQQFRVQYYDSGEVDWRRYAAFAGRDQAEACASDLEQRGLEVRVVPYNRCPTTA